MLALLKVRANEKLRVPAVTRATVFMVQQNQESLLRFAVIADLMGEDRWTEIRELRLHFFFFFLFFFK